MSLYVFVSENCKQDAVRHDKSDLLANVERGVIETQNLVGFSDFRPTLFLKKCLGRRFRLIAYRVPIHDDEVILFLRVLARGSNEYDFFLENWEEETARVTERFQPYTNGQLCQIHACLSRVPTAPPPPDPSPEERAWLYQVFSQETIKDDLFVLETEEWVRKMKAPENRDFLGLYHQMLEHIDLDALHAANSNSECRIHWVNNLGIAYLYRHSLNRLLLLEPLRQTDEVEALLGHHTNRLTNIADGQHELSRIASRTYPFIMVLNHRAQNSCMDWTCAF